MLGDRQPPKAGTAAGRTALAWATGVSPRALDLPSRAVLARLALALKETRRVAVAKTRPFRIGPDATCADGVCGRWVAVRGDRALSMPQVPGPGLAAPPAGR